MERIEKIEMRLDRDALINALRDEMGPAMIDGLGAPSMMIAEMDSYSDKHLIDLAESLGISVDDYIIDDMEEER